MKPGLLHWMVLEVEFDSGSEANTLAASLAWIMTFTPFAFCWRKKRDHIEDWSAKEKSEEDCFHKKAFECPDSRLWVLTWVFLKTGLSQLGNSHSVSSSKGEFRAESWSYVQVQIFCTGFTLLKKKLQGQTSNKCWKFSEATVRIHFSSSGCHPERGLPASIIYLKS